MLTGNALNLYSNTMQSCQMYAKSIQALRDWYSSNAKRTRILTEWQYMTVSKSMAERPTLSEVAVFKTFVAKLMTLQKKLDSHYHPDTFLCDRLLTAVDISAI